MCAMRGRFPLMLPAIVAAVISCTIFGGRAQGPAASAPSVADCTDAFLNMTGCLSYASVGSNDTTPGGDCCPELAGLIDSDPICLCELLAGGAESFGVAVDNARALRLPSLCRLDAPPVSLCSDIGIPVASPATAISPAPGSPTAATSPASSGGSRESPGSSPASSAQKLDGGHGAAAELAVAAAAAALSLIVTVIEIF